MVKGVGLATIEGRGKLDELTLALLCPAHRVVDQQSADAAPSRLRMDDKHGYPRDRHFILDHATAVEPNQPQWSAVLVRDECRVRASRVQPPHALRSRSG